MWGLVPGEGVVDMTFICSFAGPLGNIRCRLAEELRCKVPRSHRAKGQQRDSQSSNARRLQAKAPPLSPPRPHASPLKLAAEKLGIGVDDIRGAMARDGVSFFDAVVLSARNKFASSIREAGGVEAFERQKRQTAPRGPPALTSSLRIHNRSWHSPQASDERFGRGSRDLSEMPHVNTDDITSRHQT